MSAASGYRIDLQAEDVVLVPCTVQPSRISGKTICVNEDGSALCIEPWGEERTGGVPASDPNWDSPYTQATQLGDMLVYRSASNEDKGTPRGYQLVI